MAFTPFVGVSWHPLDLIDESKMDDMSNNIQYIHNNTPRASVALPGADSGARAENIKIVAGRALIPKKGGANTHTESVGFRGEFSSNCAPIITTGIQSKNQQNIYVTFTGHNGNRPDANGLKIHVEIGEQAGASASKNKITSGFQVHWIAMGF